MSEKPLSTDPTAGLTPAVAAGSHPEAKMSAAEPVLGQPNLALPPSMVDAAGQRKLVSPEVSSFMTTPLARPTGVDAIDSFLSPASLALMAPSAASAVKAAVTGFTDRVGPTIAGKVLKFVTPALLKKPAEFVGLLNDIGEAVRTKAEAPAAPAAPAPATPKPLAQNAMDEFLARVTQRQAAPAPTGTAPADATAQPPAAEPIAAPTQASPAAAAPEPVTAPAMKMSDRLNLFMRTARAANVTLSPDDYLALNKAVAAGTDPAQAVQSLIAERSPAAAFNQRFGLVTPTDAQTRFAKGMRGKATGAAK